MVEQTSLNEAPFDTFVSWLPSESAAAKADWDAILRAVLKEYPANDPWETLPGGARYNKDEHEDTVFAAMREIFDRAIKACQKVVPYCGQPTLRLSLRPTRALEHESKEEDSRPDGVMTPDGSAGEAAPYSWHNTSVTLEFKKEDKRDLDGKIGFENTSQCLWGLQHQMWSSPERRFAWAITIEGTSVRVWLAHRGGVLLSTPFDLQTEKAKLVRVLVYLAFGTEEELGWDTTMRRLDKESDLCKEAVQRADEFWKGRPREHGPTTMTPFTLQVAGRSYIAVTLIADHRARALDGSGCRVLLAYDAPPFGKSSLSEPAVAIKIVWRNDGRKSEGEIFSALMEAIEKSKQSVGEAKKYLVNILAYGDLGKAPHDISNTIMHGVDVSSGSVIRVPKDTDFYRHSETVGSPASSYLLPNSEAPGGRGRVLISATPVEPSSLMIDNRIYSAIVMEDVGQPLHHVEELHEVCSALADVVKVLKMMCIAGYNHRDISPGNIIVKRSGRGLLGDLEFAKLFGSDEGSHGERAGTLDFMSCEVLRGRWHWVEPKNRMDVVPFRHHSGHDLDSMYFNLIWFLYITEFGHGDAAQVATQRAGMELFFEQGNRYAEFTSGQPCRMLFQHFKGTDAEEAIDQHVLPMVRALKEKHKVFAELRGKERDNRIWASVHDSFHGHLKALSEYFKTVSNKRLGHVCKRLRSDSRKEPARKRQK